MRLSRHRYAAHALSAALIVAALAAGYLFGRYLPDEVADWMRR